MFPMVAAPAYVPNNRAQGSPFSTVSPTPLSLVVLLCFSLMISDAEHLFMNLLAISMSSLEKSFFLFSSSAYF